MSCLPIFYCPFPIFSCITHSLILYLLLLVFNCAYYIQKAISQNARIAQDQEEYQRQYEKLALRFESAKDRLAEVDALITERTARRETSKMFFETLRRQEGFLTAFDERLWYSLVDHVTVYAAEDVQFTFNDGTEIQVGDKE